jgi:hypothetical protein
MPDRLRELVSRRAGYRCEYCRCLELNVPYSIEHIVPAAKGGDLENPENLAWACQGCNNHKYTCTEVQDPESGSMIPLFNPRTQVWEEHFEWNAEELRFRGRTAVGRVTVERLRLNRAGVIRFHQLLPGLQDAG